MSFSEKLRNIKSKYNSNKNAKKIKKMFNLGLSWGSIVLACIAIAIKLTGHSIAGALENLLNSTIGALGNELGGIGDLIAGIPFIGGILSIPFNGCNALVELIITLMMWLPTVMGKAFDVFFTVGTIVLAVNGLAYLTAQYSVEKELMRHDIISQSLHTDIYVESKKVEKEVQELSKVGQHIQLEKNEDLKEFDINAGTKELSVFTEQHETQ